jgi:hypothetical protein
VASLSSPGPARLVPRLLPCSALLLLGGCLSELEESRLEHAAALRSVELADGIDEREATILADEYFHTYVSGCGVIGRVLERESYWEAETYVGYAAAPGEPVRIDMLTGAVSRPSGPTVEAASLLRGGLVLEHPGR